MNEPDGTDKGKNTHREHAGNDGGLPSGYGRDFIAAIARTPASVFVYWELSGERSEYYRKECPGNPVWHLSLINLDDRGEINWRTEVAIDTDAGNHYFSVQPGTRCRVELGVKLKGVFHPVCHSRAILTPYDTRRNVADEPPWGGEEGLPAGLQWREDLLNGLASGSVSNLTHD